MTLPVSGPVSLSNINVELGRAATTQISLGDTLIRTLLQKSSGAIAIADAYGKSNSVNKITTTLSMGSAYFPPEGGMWLGYRVGYGGSLSPNIINSIQITRLDYDFGVRYNTYLNVSGGDPANMMVKKGTTTYTFSRTGVGSYILAGDPLNLQSGGSMSLEISYQG